MLQLRNYQQASLDALAHYLKIAARHDAKTAFKLQTERPYRAVKDLADLPYVCLRVPTGGGKTIMACHAVGIAAREYLHVERTVCLWLVPSNAILDQTLAALRDRAHPYRQAVDASFAGQVEVMTLREALYIRRGTILGATVIIISTLAALRVEDTDGRKVYDTNENLKHIFDDINPMERARLEQAGEGVIAYSLANVLRLRRPVVIMDEAHNARTPLSFETLIRFNPSCVIEFTATPQTEHDPARGAFASNVLHHVSARELKAEEMLKLPVRLLTHPDWKEVVGGALAKQRELEESAAKQQGQTGEYIRPIVLLQAQPQNRHRLTLTVDVLKKALIDDFRVAEEQIAIATGLTRELDDVDVSSPNCPIRFIITVQALREGWDCPFAYVLCSVAEQTSARAVEQILGRIMRMPQARRKQQADLNFAYAFVTSSNFASTAASLRDALVENGFQHLEAQDLIVPVHQPSLFGDGGLFAAASAVVTETPDLSALDDNLRPNVNFDPATNTLKIQGAISAADVKAIKACFRDRANRTAIDGLRDQLHGRSTQAPTANEISLKVPLLAVRIGPQLELFDDGFFLDAPWNIAECDATLSEMDFSISQSLGTTGELDVTEAGRVEMVGFAQQLHQQLSLFGKEPNWTIPALANWLDRNIPHQDIPQAQSSLFIHNALTRLIEGRGVALDQLARLKYRLRDALEDKIGDHRREQRRAGYQAALFGINAMQMEVDPSICVTIDDDHYAPNWYYEGTFRFAKHAFKHVGEMKSDGDEFECATVIDSLPQVRVWVRNLSRGESSFWLQTATDRFYPDFVALLNDGRWLVIEYKNERDWSNDDSKEKRAVGSLWADRSKGRCLFFMPKGKEWDAIRALA